MRGTAKLWDAASPALGLEPSDPMEDRAQISPDKFFADRFNVTPSLMERLIGSNLVGRVDDADIYLEYRVNEELVLEENVVKKASRHVSQGAGVRALSETRTGYAHTDDISIGNLEEAARQARAIADRASTSGTLAVAGRGRAHDLYTLSEPPIVTALDRKLTLLRKLDTAARAADPRVSQVIASLSSEEVVMLIATASGWTIGDVRPLTRLNVTVIAEENGKREIGSWGGGGRVPFDYFLEEQRWERFATEAARQAILKLRAIDAPAGSMTVVLGPGWPGILLHEAIGHGLEGDFNRKGVSAFAGRLGQKVASELVTVVDDGTMPNRRGSLNVDDEGTPTGRTVLIENGVLTGYMQDRLNSRLMKMAATGNGRRESYAHPPMPRMTNTFMLAGQDDPGDILRSVERGLYAVAFGGGQVDITSGKFVFSASEAYLIENGKVTAPVKGATLIGNGPDALTRVSRVGHDLQLDEGVGTCGKEGQSVPVGVGLPTIRIDGMTVGGTQV
jgi:TldD protein